MRVVYCKDPERARKQVYLWQYKELKRLEKTISMEIRLVGEEKIVPRYSFFNKVDIDPYRDKSEYKSQLQKLIRELQDQRVNTLNAMSIIEEVINELPSAQEATLLKLRYILDKDRAYICNYMYLSISAVERLHWKALDHLKL